MFNDDEDEKDREREGQATSSEATSASDERDPTQRTASMEQRIERQMNKTALVTLWVDPVEHQIVKYTFDNVWMDFLPARLARQESTTSMRR